MAEECKYKIFGRNVWQQKKKKKTYDITIKYAWK
jgi:hypothetical protein